MKGYDEGKCLFAVLTFDNLDVTQGQGQSVKFSL